VTNHPKFKQGWVYRDLTALRETDVTMLPVKGETKDAPTPPPALQVAAASISGVTAHSHQIFQRGQALGNRPFIVSRVGDSISASPYFLTTLGSANVDLGMYQNELTDVWNFFKGSFTRPFFAAGNGWGADRLLQPGYSNPGTCGSDSPIVCEYKQAKPAIALIMIGTNDSGGVDPAVYEANLRQIVQISIDMGVIPVLSTIPPKQNTAWNAARANEWNGIIRLVAQQYDVPLMDYWAALQGLPGQGISEDGIHPSFPPGGNTARFTLDGLNYGYTMRNLIALQALNALWRNVMY